MRGISWVAEDILAPQEGPCSMELVRMGNSFCEILLKFVSTNQGGANSQKLCTLHAVLLWQNTFTAVSNNISTPHKHSSVVYVVFYVYLHKHNNHVFGKIACFRCVWTKFFFNSGLSSSMGLETDVSGLPNGLIFECKDVLNSKYGVIFPKRRFRTSSRRLISHTNSCVCPFSGQKKRFLRVNNIRLIKHALRYKHYANALQWCIIHIRLTDFIPDMLFFFLT
jgi:hypothetical protein